MIEPWKLRCGYIERHDGERVADLATEDAEEQVLMLRAREMWDSMQIFSETPVDSPEGHAIDKTICALVRKIESEIAAARKP